VSGERTYEASAARVEEIIRRLDSGEASLNETLELVREGKELIEYCARELEAVGGALEELRLEELVARLEREGGANGVAPADAGGRGGTGGRGGAGEERGGAVGSPGG
jgi:exodeoxyribonuclease VII small subunit